MTPAEWNALTPEAKMALLSRLTDAERRAIAGGGSGSIASAQSASEIHILRSNWLVVSLSVVSSAAALAWAGINAGSTLVRFSSANGWVSIGLLFFVALPALCVAVVGGFCPAFYGSRRIVHTTRRRLLVFALVAIGFALLDGILGLLLSGRGGC